LPPPDEPATYIPSATPGGRIPHYWIGEKESVFDRLGEWFNLVRIGPDAPAVSNFEQAAKKLNMPMAVVQLDEAAAEEFYQARLLLVRPDQHVAWRSNDVPDDVAEILKTVIGS